MPSSVIYGMVYSPQRRVLDVVFRDHGEVYRYFDVQAEEWRAFKRAPSKGTYLNAVFKARHPRSERLGAAPGQLDTTLLAQAVNPPQTPRDRPDENVWGFYE